jgi:hypothetical protein
MVVVSHVIKDVSDAAASVAFVNSALLFHLTLFGSGPHFLSFEDSGDVREYSDGVTDAWKFFAWKVSGFEVISLGIDE